MLSSLFIKNYKNLKELKINSLGRVNLITGKNNTGKSTILESISMYASKGDLNFIYKLLEERGEYYKQSTANKNPTEYNVRSLSSLFTNRLVSYDRKDSISIGNIENTLFGEESTNTLSIGFVRYIDELQRDNQSIITRKRIFIDESNTHLDNVKIGLEIKTDEISYVSSLDNDRPYRLAFRGIGETESFQFIRSRNIDSDINGKLFDNVALTEKEQYVIEALKIIEPFTERIAFIEESPRERTAVVKLSNAPNVLPLQSMGDGINRILTIILALVNCDNGFLLIDEFENGLHHSVQEKLWKVIFNLAEKLNVQVFSTTHSEDCIAGFEAILNNQSNSLDGKLIRLDKVNGSIKQVEYNPNELRIAAHQNIETR